MSVIDQGRLWADYPLQASPDEVAPFLNANHYLGQIGRGFALVFESGVMVFANPSSRFLRP